MRRAAAARARAPRLRRGLEASFEDGLQRGVEQRAKRGGRGRRDGGRHEGRGKAGRSGVVVWVSSSCEAVSTSDVSAFVCVTSVLALNFFAGQHISSASATPDWPTPRVRMVDRDAFAGLPAELHADVLSRLSPADIARYRVAASASKQTAAHSADIAELAAREALLAFAERTYTDFVKGAREVWTDGTEYSADANDMCKLVEEPLGPVTRLGGPHGRREWPEIVQVLACDPDSFEPLDLTEGVYERHVSDGRVTMMTYDDGEWDGAPRRGIGRRDAALSELIAPLPGETWLGCWAATCAFVAAGTNATLGACRTDRRTDRPSRPLAPLPEKGYPGLVAPICLQRRRRQLLWLMFGGADARESTRERKSASASCACTPR